MSELHTRWDITTLPDGLAKLRFESNLARNESGGNREGAVTLQSRKCGLRYENEVRRLQD
jgi:hypothetical protein